MTTYQEPNEHGVYDAEYVIAVKIDKNITAGIALCETALGWLWAADYQSAKGGFGSPLSDKSRSHSWRSAIESATREIKDHSTGWPEEKAVLAKLNELIEKIPFLRVEDFKVKKETERMAKTKKPAATNEATTAHEAAATSDAAETLPDDDKIYLEKYDGKKSEVMAFIKPLTDHAKKLISDEMDVGCLFDVIDQGLYRAVGNDGTTSLPAVTEEQNAAVQKLISYEPPIKKVTTCSEYFEELFTSNEIKQMAMEFSDATSRKSGLEEELKSHSQYLKSQVTEVTATINRISQELSRGKRSISVRCHWVFNEPIRGLKSLYRLDKEPKELVRTDRMTASDKQLTLEDIATASAKKERTVEEKEVTAIANEPYEGELMSDAEVEKETGFTVQPEPDETPFAESEESSDCPI